MKLHPKQIEAVLALSGPERYEHFIKQVVDWEQVWGVYNEGWDTAQTDGGVEVVPFWPAEDYATLCAKDDWKDCEPAPIPLHDFMGDLLPSLERDGVLPGIFCTPAEFSVTPTIEELLRDLNRELEKYA